MTDSTDITRTAWHEPGHVVAYLVHRRRFRYVTTRSRQYRGQVAVRPRRIDPLVQLVIAHAGPMAQGLHELAILPAGYLADEGFTEDDVMAGAYIDGGQDDVAVIRATLSALGATGCGETDQLAERITRDVLTRNWPVVDTIAAALIEHRTLTYPEVLALPGVAEGCR